jgi:hypothetical protein
MPPETPEIDDLSLVEKLFGKPLTLTRWWAVGWRWLKR